MTKEVSNLGVLMNLLEITNVELAIVLNVNPSLISRWRTGDRVLNNRQDPDKEVAKYLFNKENILKENYIEPILKAFYLDKEEFDNIKDKINLLEKWLTTNSQSSDTYIENRKQILINNFSTKKNEEEDIVTIYGIDNIQKRISYLLGYFYEECKPDTLLTIYSSDTTDFLSKNNFAIRLHALGDKLYERGFKTKSAMCGKYQAGYIKKNMALIYSNYVYNMLLGNLEIYYYDSILEDNDFYAIFIFPNNYAFVILKDAKYEAKGILYTNKNEIDKLCKRVEKEYFKNAKKRLFVDFFKEPNGFLKDKKISNCNTYIFQEFPNFGLGKTLFTNNLNLAEDEIKKLDTEFLPLLKSPCKENNHYYILNTNSIDEALDNQRFLSSELSEIINRNIYINTQSLINQLVILYKLLKENKNFNICFLRKEQFEKLPMQIAIWQDEAAIFWIKNQNSAVTINSDSIMKSTVICEQIWDGIPNNIKARSCAEEQLIIWLKRISLYRYKYHIPKDIIQEISKK